MSHYNVNASVPKTLIQHLLRWVISSHQFDGETGAVLESIIDTEISPELVPHETDDQSQPAQSTEAKVGPYDLQDFTIYYATRYGFRPAKLRSSVNMRGRIRCVADGRMTCRLRSTGNTT